MTPDDADRLAALRDYWRSSRPIGDGYDDVGGSAAAESVFHEVRFLLRLLDEERAAAAAAADHRADRACPASCPCGCHYGGSTDRPTYVASPSSTAYMCGHHPFELRRADRPGTVSVCGLEDAERLVVWLNRHGDGDVDR